MTELLPVVGTLLLFVLMFVGIGGIVFLSSTSLGLPSPRRSAFRTTPTFQINTC
jgi:hypothetical protein